MKAFSLTDTSIILNWLHRARNLSTKNCACWISFWNCTIRDILQWIMYNIKYIHASGVVFKRVLECQIRNSFLVLSQNKRCYNLETFKRKHKKFGTQSETSLLINCGKLFSLPSKKWGSSWPESSSGITQICYQKISIISIIRFYWSNNQSEFGS